MENQPTKSPAPSLSLPKGGGAIRGIGEKFAANPVTGTGSLTVPIPASPSRSGFGPQLTLSYDSGSGNGPFGFGWTLALPSIARKTDKGLPRYRDSEESDVFVLSGSDDLAPVLTDAGEPHAEPRTIDGIPYDVRRYRPRIEGLFARLERWTSPSDPRETFWRSISRDNITTWYGRTIESRIADPADPSRIFQWLICETHDDNGNVVIYSYKPESSDGVLASYAHERNRSDASRTANRYLKRVRYGNRTPYFPQLLEDSPWPSPLGVSDPDAALHWLFEMVLDYGEHDAANPRPGDVGVWNRRNDTFSTYRATFEIRTSRLCQRILMFHHFPDEEGVGADCLVRSTDLSYSYEASENDPRNPIFSFLLAATQRGYRRAANGADGYVSRSLPPLEFEYTQPVVRDEIHEIDPASLENLPHGLDNARYKWVDLNGEGLSGILTEQAEGWFFKRNLSPIPPPSATALAPGPTPGPPTAAVQFAAIEPVRERPAFAEQSSGSVLLDLAGDGQLDLVDFGGPVPGFFERTRDERWESFAAFRSLPVVDWADSNLRFVDLTGDGHADVLITGDEVLTWHPSLAEGGFGAAETMPLASDEEKGPRLVFADGTQSIYLADFSGDGLSDVVRIRNGELCYWPNLGYGRFGSKVAMDAPPWFDALDAFDQRRIRLADIDGSGLTDIIYLGRGGVDLYFNQSGNAWSAPRRLAVFPAVDDASAVQVADLLGNGTACLIWSSALPGDARRPMRYIDLMGGQKPYLAIAVINNLGADTRIQYAPSTKFFIADRRQGRPWITRLPFPVHVVERVDTHDHIGRNHFVTTYAYSHGHYDGLEREFRGFGLVEQRDSQELGALTADGTLVEGENVDPASHVPTVLTRTWFHTGSDVGSDRREYYREPGATDEQAAVLLLDDTVLPSGLTADEEREARRALKGSMLRQEIFALDGSSTDEHSFGHPYTVAEHNLTVERVQSKGRNRHAVFFTHARESITYHYERNPTDPRVGHAMTLEVDAYGNPDRSLVIAYPRRAVADRKPEQRAMHVMVTVNGFANHANEADWYRVGVPIETRTFELVKPPYPVVTATSVERLAFEDVRMLITGLWPIGQTDPADAASWPYEKWDWRTNAANAPPDTRLRLIEHVRTLYRRDDLTAVLPLGEVQSLALTFDRYMLALTSDLLSVVYTRRRDDEPPESLLPDPVSVLGGTGPDQGGYVDLSGDGRWWVPSGRKFYSIDADDADPAATAAAELAEARAHFFLERKLIDPFGQPMTIGYDAYSLLRVSTVDALQNVVTAVNDYRVLQPRRTIDPNGNRSEIAYAALGFVAGTAIIGKDGIDVTGDSLAAFESDLAQEAIDQFNDAEDPHAVAPGLLGAATSRVVYDLSRFQRTHQANPTDPGAWLPACAATLARETHASDPPPDGVLRIQIGFSYSDGFGRAVQNKMQAEPGPIADDGPIVSPRWIGTGWTIFNNKGKPVRQYEPFFSQRPDRRHQFEFGVQAGVSAVLFYDPMDRVVATLHPDHSWEKVVFDPWRQATFDRNDTVLNAEDSSDPRDDASIAPFLVKLPDEAYLPSWYAARINLSPTDPARAAAERTALHRQTPTVEHLDTLGRVCLSDMHNRFERDGEIVDEHARTRLELDIESQVRLVRDRADEDGVQGRVIARHDYNMLGGRLSQFSMEAGERWMLPDVSGQAIRAWDSRGHTFVSAYDELRRPSQKMVSGTDPSRSDPRTLNGVVLFEWTNYGESQPDAEAFNLRTRPFALRDGAGVATSEAYDVKGNLVSSRRTLVRDHTAIADWNGAPDLGETLTTSTAYDALNRPIRLTTHDGSVIRPIYNDASLLERLDVSVRGEAAGGEPIWMPFVVDIDYNARRQRERIEYGNGVVTTYDYDPNTFRLTRMLTVRSGTALQDLRYTHDASGHITNVADGAQQTVFFDNAVVSPDLSCVYDAIYRLIAASGREHAGLLSSPQTTWDDEPRTNRPHPNDGQAMRRYTERYEYDETGNILATIHEATNGSWTRTYVYDEPSLIDPAARSNRLSRTAVGATVEPYVHDAHGNIVSMPHAASMQWDFLDRLWRVELGGGGIAYYVYDSLGQRTRKVWEKSTNLVEERIDSGGCEIFRRVESGVITLERQTLHVMDDKQRIALVETRTQGSDGSPEQVVRFQCGNHLGSACLELDASGQTISYEEFFPYGSTSYQAVRADVSVSRKRYRYSGKERDEESGLYYFGARYYAPWIGRWTSGDPKGLDAGLNVFVYAKNDPIGHIDPKGRDPQEAEENKPPVPPEAGKHPQAVLAESEFGPLWEEALERRYGGGSPARNQQIYLERLAKAANKEQFGAQEYANTYKVFKDLVSKHPKLAQYDWENVQLHHMAAKRMAPVPEPELAVNPNNLLFTRGNARTPGTSHNIAQLGPGEMRRQRAEIARRQASAAAAPRAPRASPPVAPQAAAPPVQPIGPPAPPPVEPIGPPAPLAELPPAAPAAPAPKPAAPGAAARAYGALMRASGVVGGVLGTYLGVVQVKQMAEEIKFIFEGDPNAPVGAIKHTVTYGTVQHIGGDRWVSLNTPES